MLVTSNTPFSAMGPDMSDAVAKRTDAAFMRLFEDPADPKTMLREMTRDGVEGMMKWKVRELEKQTAEKALASRGLTLEDIAALPPKERIALEQQIMREVAEKLKEAMNEQMKRQRHVGELDTYYPQSPAAKGIDIRA